MNAIAYGKSTFITTLVVDTMAARAELETGGLRERQFGKSSAAPAPLATHYSPRHTWGWTITTHT